MAGGRIAPLLGVALALAAGALAVATAAPASAADRCYQPSHRYDCKDPEATGCASGATNVDSATRTVGGRSVVFELRWSSRCVTNWIRVRNWPSGRTRLQIDVADYPRNVFADYAVRRNSSGYIGAGTHWGNMVYSPADHCAIGGVDYAGDTNYEVVLRSSRCPY